SLALLLDVSAPAPVSRVSGPVSGACRAAANSPRPGPFSPRPPPLVAQPCSVASSTLRACPTPLACSSSAMPFGFPRRPTSPLTVGRLEVSQIQAKCFRTCMGPQTPGAPARLAYRRTGYCLPPAPTASAPPTDIDFEARNPA